MSKPKLSWVHRAARICYSYQQNHWYRRVIPRKNEFGDNIEHIVWMIDELAGRKIESETKVCRWLGYIQCFLVINGYSTLEEEKRRNLFSDPG